LKAARTRESSKKALSAFLMHARGPKFDAVLEEVADMAADGRLREILGAGILLSHRYALQGKHEVATRPVPVVRTMSRHSLVRADLAPFVPVASQYTVADTCRKLDLSVSLSQLTPQWDHALACFGSSPVDHRGWIEGFELLKSQRTEKGKTYLESMIELVSQNTLGGDEIRAIYDWMIGGIDAGTMDQSLHFARLWIGSESSPLGRTLRPALDLLGETFNGAREKLRSLQVYTASVLRRPDFPKLTDRLRNAAEAAAPLLDLERPIVPASRPPEAQWDRIKRWVANKECRSITATTPQQWERAKNARAAEIIQEYREGLTNWDLVDGKARTRFSALELRESARELLMRFADPSASRGESSLMSLPVRVAARLRDRAREQSRQLGKRVTPGEYLAHWLQERSSDHELVRFFYPDQKLPRVRLLNTLDRLELVLLNNDFKAPGIPPTNHSLRFARELAEAWGDEPESEWPSEIRKLYPAGSGKRPKKLQDVVREIERFQRRYEKLVGFPDMPKCKNLEGGPEDTVDPDSPFIEIPNWFPGPIEEIKAGLFHNRQILHTLKQNLPDSGHTQSGGLKLIRDLLYEFYASTPERHRDSNDAAKTNLGIVLKLARMGALRQLGQLSWRFAPSDGVLTNAVDQLVETLTSSEVSSWLPTLAQPALTLFEIYEAVDPASGYSDEGVSSSAFMTTQVKWRAQIQALQQSAAYESVQAKELGEGLWAFVAERSEDPRLRAASRKLRLQLAQELESGGTDQLMLLISRKPDEFYRLLEGFAASSERGEMIDFLNLLRRSVR
jgi:hypothetical protein